MLDRLRAKGCGWRITNQSGLSRGYFTEAQMRAVRARIEELLGPFDTWRICPHSHEAGCCCRKPQPGLVLAAAADLGVDPRRCVVVGDIGADVGAAQPPCHRSPGADAADQGRGCRAAPLAVADLAAAADWILDGTGALLDRRVKSHSWRHPAGMCWRSGLTRPGMCC